MQLFYLITFVSLLLSKINNKILLFIFMIVLVVIAGYRDVTVGTDTLNYYLNFIRYQSGSEMRFTEPLWYVTNKLVIYFNGDFDMLKVVASTLTLAPFFYGIKKTSKYPFLSIFIFLTFYYYFYSFNIIRQCIACSWCFLGLTFFKEDEKKNWRTYIFILIGILFHYTAAIFFFMLLAYRVLKKMQFNLFALQLISALIGIGFSSLFINFAAIYLEDYATISSMEGSLVSSVINIIILNVGFIFVSNFLKTKDKWFYFFYFFIILTNLMIRVPFGNRFIMYAGITLCAFIPNIFDNLKLSKKYNLLVTVIIVLYCFSRFVRILGSGEILPYNNVLFE